MSVEALEPQNQVVAPGTFWRLMGYMRPHMARLIVAFALLGAATATDVLQPILVKIFIDQNLIPRHFPQTRLVELGAGYLLLVILTAFFNVLQLYLFQILALDIIQRLRVDLFDRVQTLALSFFDQTPVGVLVSRITNDTQAILDMFMTVLSSFVQNIAVLIGVMVAMFSLDARLAVYCLLFFPVIALVMWLYQKISSPVFWAGRQRLAILNAKLNESLQGMGIIQAMRQEPRLRREFGDINESYRQVRYKNTQLNGLLLRPLVEVIYLLALMVVLGFFGLRSYSHVANIGIHTGRGLVQHQNRRTVGHRAGKRHQLALTGGKGCPPLPNRSVVSAGKLFNEAIGLHKLGRLLHFRVGNVLISEPDVRGDVPHKQKRVLKNEPHLPSKFLLRELAQIVTIDGDATPFHRIKSH